VAAEEYRLHLTISRATRDKLRQVQALLSHQLPDGNPAVIFDRALELLLKALERQRAGVTDRPRKARAPKPRARRAPAAVRREVWARDEARCAFIGPHGRCKERKFLEFHHRKPYADDGGSTADNIELRCRAHNVYEAELHFGREVVSAARARRQAAKNARAKARAREAAELVPGRVKSERPARVHQRPPTEQQTSEPVTPSGTRPPRRRRRSGGSEARTVKRRRSKPRGPKTKRAVPKRG
jgi:5-methylcytosine-specific restriction endonuclease McrA